MLQWIFIFYIPVLFGACLELPGHWAEQFSSCIHLNNIYLLKNSWVLRGAASPAQGFPSPYLWLQDLKHVAVGSQYRHVQRQLRTTLGREQATSSSGAHVSALHLCQEKNKSLGTQVLPSTLRGLQQWVQRYEIAFKTREAQWQIVTLIVQHFGLTFAVLGVPRSCVSKNTGVFQDFYNILTALAPLI